MSARDGNTIGAGLALPMATNLTAEAGVDEWILKFRSLGELDGEEVWFRWAEVREEQKGEKSRRSRRAEEPRELKSGTVPCSLFLVPCSLLTKCLWLTLTLLSRSDL